LKLHALTVPAHVSSSYGALKKTFTCTSYRHDLTE
jgi:hypothetical protein